METRGGALAGVRVLDLATESAVYCGKLLADLGADVIKVEPPGGVAMRRIGPFYGGAEHPDRSLFFWHYNTNKRSVVLDHTSSRDQNFLRQLIATADIVVDTVAAESRAAAGLEYPALAEQHPHLIVVSITPFGQTGPHRARRMTDLVAQAVGGMLHLNGARHESPLQGVGLQAYHSASLYAATAALLALLARSATGRGQWIDVSTHECVVSCVEHASSLWHQHGRVVERAGALHWTRDFRVGRCADGWVVQCALGDWTALVEWVKADGMAAELANPAWEDLNYRRDHCDRLFAILERWASRYRSDELVAGARLRRLAYAPVERPETLAVDPQLRQRGFFVALHHEELPATVRYPGAPYILSRTPWQLRRRAPLVGEHTEEVLRELKERVPLLHEQRNAEHHALPPLPSRQALRGVRILDFTWVVAGPLTTRMLADHGAEVIKVERPRRSGARRSRDEFAGHLNRGKQSIAIDLDTEPGRALAFQLAAKSDVVIDNFSARVMANWGLDELNLRAHNDRLITVHMSGFGHTGPYRDLVSYGPTLQALCGHTWLMQSSAGEPLGWGFSYADVAAGVSAAVAILAALWHRQRTGQGQYIDVAQFETLTALLGPGMLDVLVHGATWTPIDNSSQEMPSAPYGVYRCADAPADDSAQERWCALAVVGNDAWGRFCRAIGNPPWTDDPRFATAEQRMHHRTVLNQHVEAWSRTQTAEDVATRLQNAGIAAGLVANAADLCERDPQLRSRRYWVRLDTPEGNRVIEAGIPFKMSATPGHVRSAGPLLGEHTDAILQRVLRMSPSDIVALRAAHVVA